MIVLGIDPGPTRSGWALLEYLDRDPRARVLDCGHSSEDAVEGAIRASSPGLVVAVEWPSFRPHGAATDHAKHNGMARHLVGTALVAGRLAGLAEGLGLRVVRPSAGDVRRALVGRPNATDAQVAAMLGYHVELPTRSNEHARDAMAVAVVGARMADREPRRVA